MVPIFKRWPWLLIAVAVVGLVFALRHLFRDRDRTIAENSDTRWVDDRLSPSRSSGASPVSFAGDTPSSLQQFCQRIRGLSDRKSVQIQLMELRATFSNQPTEVAVAEIRSFLDSGEDVPTQLEFKIGENGFLGEAPTLRTYLLDALGRLNSTAAAEYARVVLAQPDSPDEWALALRNLARGDLTTEGRALLQQKAGEMLSNTQWQHSATTGFLEAFDVPVHLGGTEFLPLLTEISRQADNPATAHASFLALDRLVIADPASTLAAFLKSPELMQAQDSTRGNFFARADVRYPQQRRILEDYLGNPGLSSSEMQTFTVTFPNGNFMVSANLLSPQRTISRRSLVSRDLESLRVVREWMGDSRFADRLPDLKKMELRLSEFVRAEESRP